MNKWFSRLFEKEVEKEDILTLIEEIRAEVSSITPVNPVDVERISNVKSVLDEARLRALDITRKLRMIEVQIETTTKD